VFFIRPRTRHSRSPSARTISSASCFTTATGDGGNADVGGAAGISSLAASWGAAVTSGSRAGTAASEAALAAKEEGADATCDKDTAGLERTSPKGSAERSSRPRDFSAGVTSRA